MKYSNEDLLDEISRVAEIVGQPPTTSDIEDHGNIALSTFFRRISDEWSDILEEAGFNPDSVLRSDQPSDDELLEEIRRLAGVYGRPPMFGEMNEEGEYAASTCASRFGSWSEAKEEAGLDSSRIQPHQRVDRAKLIEQVKDAAEEVGRAPSTAEIIDAGEHSDSAYYRVWDTHEEILEAAGIEPENLRKVKQQVNKDDLLDALQQAAEELGHSPDRDWMNKHGEYTGTTYQNRFGSWNAALEEAGLEPNHEFGVLEAVICHYCGEEFKKEPNQIEGKNHHFCSDECRGEWLETPSVSTLCDQCGEEHLISPVGANNNSYCSQECYEENWRGKVANPVDVDCANCNTEFKRNAVDAENGANYCRLECFHEHKSKPGERDFYYGSNWPKQRTKALKRDNFQCQDCGVERETHRTEFGKDLHVHHITPAREFDDPKKRNRLRNLVTLCAECHKKWEGIPLRPA